MGKCKATTKKNRKCKKHSKGRLCFMHLKSINKPQKTMTENELWDELFVTIQGHGRAYVTNDEDVLNFFEL